MQFSKFTNLFRLSKTLSFELKPIGSTLMNIESQQLIIKDTKISENLKTVKEILNDYHRYFINIVLNNIEIDLSDLFNNFEGERENFTKIKAGLKKSLASKFKNHMIYEGLFSSDVIKTHLLTWPEVLVYDVKMLEEMANYGSYLLKYNTHRKYIYDEDSEYNSVVSRTLDDNVEIFYNNIQAVNIVKDHVNIYKISDTGFEGNIQDFIDPTKYGRFVSQKGIDNYNCLISGYMDKEQVKHKGINELIAHYNQGIKSSSELKPLPFLTKLKKQILSIEEGKSFRFGSMIDSDSSLLDLIEGEYKALNEYEIQNKKDSILNVLSETFKSLNKTKNYDISKIYINPAKINDFSHFLFKNWNILSNSIENYYKNIVNPCVGKITKKYLLSVENYVKKTPHSLQTISEALDAYSQYLPEDCRGSFFAKLHNLGDKKSLIVHILETRENYQKNILDNCDKLDLIKNKQNNHYIKDFLSSILELLQFCKFFSIKERIALDHSFYYIIDTVIGALSVWVKIYAQAQAYLTSKPFSKLKIPLTFNAQELLNGWDKDKESAYRASILIKDELYYLAITDNSNKKFFTKLAENNGNLNTDLPSDNFYRRMEYKQVTGMNKMLPKVYLSSEKGRKVYKPSKYIIDNYAAGKHKKGTTFNLEFCHDLIDYFKKSIKLNSSWSIFNFEFRDTSEYNDISEFYNEIESQAYHIEFYNVSKKVVDDAVDSGEIYLFQIYNKDFSTKRTSKKDKIHTMYFKELFSEQNISNTIFKLNGGSSIFYRPASIRKEDAIIHQANTKIERKNASGASIKKYEIIKDRRYTEDKFLLNLPITINYKQRSIININHLINKEIIECKELNILGIHRGERNLISYCVVNKSGTILEQGNLDVINNFNFNEKLNEVQYKRQKSRYDWNTIENIKEIKEGYLSQVINEICKLITKYNAIIAIENLNSAFKQSRSKIDKQIYAKFEDMLLNKLNYLTKKDCVRNGYQLTNKATDFTPVFQSGIVFFVSPYFISNVDPLTGYVPLLYFKHKTLQDSQHQIRRFQNICYDRESDRFEFLFNYKAIGLNHIDKTWLAVSSNSSRYIFDKEFKSYEPIQTTNALKDIFNRYCIELSDNMIESIIENGTTKFYLEFFEILNCLLTNNHIGPNKNHIVSPIVNDSGLTYDSRVSNKQGLPSDADTNAAYNLVQKAFLMIGRLSSEKYDLFIKNEDWISFLARLN